MANQDRGFLLSHARVSSKRHKGIKGDDIFNLFQQLSTMIQAGMPLMDALLLCAEQTQSKKLGAVMDAIAGKVQNGSSLWSAAAEYPRIFESHWVQVIRTGEISGQIGPLMGRLTQNMKDNREAKGKLISAMIYPSIIFCVAVAAIVIMMWFVVPTFTQFFKETGSQLPGITRAVIGFSDFLQHYGIYLVMALGAAGYGFWRWIKTPNGSRTFTAFLMALPVFGEVLVNAAMEKFANNLALLLRAGMPLLDGLYAMDGIFEKNVPYRESLAEVQKRVASGGALATGLAEGHLFTPIMVNLVRVGEESGQLPLVLEQVSMYYKQKVAALAARITAMIEPCIILGMGVTVAVILTAIYLPMFNMGGAVH
jgi:type IV pilus assembly protein PilC